MLPFGVCTHERDSFGSRLILVASNAQNTSIPKHAVSSRVVDNKRRSQDFCTRVVGCGAAGLEGVGCAEAL